MKRIIPYTQNQEMINLGLECMGIETLEHKIDDQIHNDLIELRRFVDQVEKLSADVDNLIVDFAELRVDIRNALKGGTS